MRDLSMYTYPDLSILIYGVVGVQEGYADPAHRRCRHLYCELNVGIYRV